MSLLFRQAANGMNRVTPTWFLSRVSVSAVGRAQLKPRVNQSSRNVSSSAGALTDMLGRTVFKKGGNVLKTRRRIISTLDPKKLGAQHIVDVSGLRCAVFANASPNPSSPKIHYAQSLQGGKKQFHPYPPATCGFFYFHRPSPPPHVAAGEVRFRVVPPDARSLSAGDLFAQGDRDRALVAGIQVAGRRRILESISDPFIINTRNLEPSLAILHQESIYVGKVFLFACRPRSEWRKDRTGKVMVRFEVANVQKTRPASRNRDRAQVVLRVLKIIEPPSAEDSEIVNQMFQEGKLAQVFDLKTRTTIGPWASRNPHSFMTPSSMKVLEDLYLKQE
ncbi:hypothetical protein NMY22_g3622 [Coprinellus aureogranulatus]|nr:hypothetical protein NMY22_g3622 [Coprinellus aureogranulatus]